MIATKLTESIQSCVRRVRAGALATAAAVTLGSTLFAPISVRADTLYMCGHEIRTYPTGDGYILIGSVSGVTWENQRTDIVVWGMTAEGFLDRTPVLAAMYAGVKFAWMYSRIAINGHDQEGNCNIVLH